MSAFWNAFGNFFGEEYTVQIGGEFLTPAETMESGEHIIRLKKTDGEPLLAKIIKNMKKPTARPVSSKRGKSPVGGLYALEDYPDGYYLLVDGNYFDYTHKEITEPDNSQVFMFLSKRGEMIEGDFKVIALQWEIDEIIDEPFLLPHQTLWIGGEPTEAGNDAYTNITKQMQTWKLVIYQLEHKGFFTSAVNWKSIPAVLFD